MSRRAEPCINCNIIPEDLLTVICHHNLCLRCAASRLYLSLQNNIFSDSISCEFCQRVTRLDQNSLQTLSLVIVTLKEANSLRQVGQCKFQALFPSSSEKNRELFFSTLKERGIGDETITLLAKQQILSLDQVRECTQESLKVIGIQLSEVLKLKKM